MKIIDTCCVSVAFREPYISHSRRQQETLRTSDISSIVFEDELPALGKIIKENIVAHFQKSLYGFKPHAIQHAICAGYKKVIWLDPSILPQAPIEILTNSLNEHPMIIRTGEHPLKDMCNAKSKKWFGFQDEELEGVKHIGGTVYAFNFNETKVVECFNLWKKAEEEGIFGTQDDFMSGHWADEACMALAMHKTGIPQYWEEKFNYLNQKEL